ncbi:hypothetical protein, partial [Sphingomonas parapaucimobilis]|uniref:hypothetical protein n=1 Tax=Sphingomonas parapaucimobilis TaxID=28213 RepID=UPI0035C82D09
MASRWYDSIERRQDMSFGYLLPGAHPTFVDHWRQAYGSGELAAGPPAQPARRTNDNAALGGGVSSFIAVVAGAGFEPAAFRL